MSEQTTTTSRKILVIDDEPSIIAYLTTVLEDEGYVTCSTSDPLAALDVAQQHRPDLITLDIMMPKRSGIAFYQILKRDAELGAVPVVFVSAFARASDFRSTVFRKMVPDETIPAPEAYVEKPIDVASFLRTVASLIDAGDSVAASSGRRGNAP